MSSDGQPPDRSERCARSEHRGIAHHLPVSSRLSLDPHAIKPGSTMPDLLRDLDASTKRQDVEALTHFLVSLGGPLIPSNAPSDAKTVEQGRKLFHTIGCLACHAPEKKGETTIPSVPLGNLAMKTSVETLTLFLLDPTQDRPAGRMPNLQLSRCRGAEHRVYLLREQIDQSAGRRFQGGAEAGGPLRSVYNTSRRRAASKHSTSFRRQSSGSVGGFTLDIPKRPATRLCREIQRGDRHCQSGKVHVFHQLRRRLAALHR